MEYLDYSSHILVPRVLLSLVVWLIACKCTAALLLMQSVVCFFFSFSNTERIVNLWATFWEFVLSSRCIFFLDSISIKPVKLKKWRQIRSGNRTMRFYFLFSIISKPATGNYMTLQARAGTAAIFSVTAVVSHLILQRVLMSPRQWSFYASKFLWNRGMWWLFW